MGLYEAYVDLTKAFDTVSRDGLGKRSARSGEAQWISVRQLPHFQRQQAGMHSGPHFVLHLLEHHAP